MKKQELYFESVDHRRIRQIIVSPKGKIKGYLQFVCDMYDYIDRYENVMDVFAQYGFLCFGMDFPGHGKNCQKLGDMEGYSFDSCIQDIHQSYVETMKKYIPDLDPITIKDKNGNERQLLKPQLHAMIGIGFGCSVIRSYCNRYKDVNALVFIGDSIHNRYAKLLKKCAKLKSDQSSVSIREELQGKYNDYFDDNQMYRNTYRQNNLKEIRKINSDLACNFEYTNESMTLLLSILSQYSLGQWAQVFDRYMPLYELSGFDDPVNRYCRDIDDICKKLKANGARNVFHKYYEKNRHEVLLENKDIVKDMNQFFVNIINGLNQMYSQSLEQIK